jgi:hypothetical protein
MEEKPPEQKTKREEESSRWHKQLETKRKDRKYLKQNLKCHIVQQHSSPPHGKTLPNSF